MATPRRPAWRRAYQAALRSIVPSPVLGVLLDELGHPGELASPAAVVKAAAESFPLDGLAAPMARLSPLGKATLRWLVGRLALADELLARGVLRVEDDVRPVALPLEEALDVVRAQSPVRPYEGPCVAPGGRQVAALVGGLVGRGDTCTLPAAPVEVLRATRAQLEAAHIAPRVGPLISGAGNSGARRRVLDEMLRGLPKGERLSPFLGTAVWDRRIFRAAVTRGVDALNFQAEAERVAADLCGDGPAGLLRSLVRSWVLDEVGEGHTFTDVFGPSGWRLTASLAIPAPALLLRIGCAAALETLPVDEWVEAAPFVEHLHRTGLLAPTALRIARAYADPQGVGVANRRPDCNDGEPFRLALPMFLRHVLGAPLVFGVVDVALAPPGESAFRFSGPKARIRVAENAAIEVTHLRRTALAAEWLDPLPSRADQAHGPGTEGLDALADLLGLG